MDRLNKEDRENIKALNEVLQMKYRTKPYDFKNPKDIIEYTEMITSEYMDVDYYCTQVDDVLEKYDESLEIYHPSEWLKLTQSPKTKSIFRDVHNAITKATDKLEDLRALIKKDCEYIWTIILNEPLKEVHDHFFGEIIDIRTIDIHELLEDFFIKSAELEYKYNVQENAKVFANALKEEIAINS